MVLWQAGAANLAKDQQKDYVKLEPTFQNFIEEGKKFTLFDYMDAKLKGRTAHIKKFFQEVEAIIDSTLPVLPFNTKDNVPMDLKRSTIFMVTFTYPFNLAKTLHLRLM